jgi:hypothetical protein
MRFSGLLLGISRIDNTKKEQRPDDILYPTKLSDDFYEKRKSEYF